MRGSLRLGRAGAPVLGLLMLGGAGCGEAGLVLLVPEAALEFSSMVLWANEELEASAGDAIQRELPASEDRVELVLLTYEQSLTELGLAAGPVAEGVSCRPCALVRPAGSWSAVIEAGEASVGWSTHATAPAEVQAALVPDLERCDRCPTFSSPEVADERPGPGTNITLLTPWADGELVLYTDGTLRQLSRSAPGSMHTPACLRSDDFRPAAAYRATDTVVWVVDFSGRVHQLALDQLDPAADCKAATTMSSTVTWTGPIPTRLAGAPVANPAELFGIALELSTGDAVISRHQPGVRTELLGRLEGPENEVALAWVDPGEVVAVNGSPKIMRIEGGVARYGRVEVDGLEIYVSTVIPGPPREWYFGTSNTLVVLEDQFENFSYLASFESNAQRVDAILKYRDGLAIGERNGTFRLYHRDVGYCPPQRGFGAAPINHLVEGRRGELVGGDSTLYSTAPPRDDCRFPGE